jgi:hypothetical protein
MTHLPEPLNIGVENGKFADPAMAGSADLVPLSLDHPFGPSNGYRFPMEPVLSLQINHN